MSRQEIAKILFQFHQQIWNDPERLEKDWNNLEDDRSFSCIYEISKREYLRMADGVRKKILPPKEPSLYSKEELAEISWK